MQIKLNVYVSNKNDEKEAKDINCSFKKRISCVISLHSYQVSVDKVGALQVDHPLTNIHTHCQQVVLWKTAFFTPQELCQAAVLHELKYQIQRWALSDHSKQLYQFRMRQFPVEKAHDRAI